MNSGASYSEGHLFVYGRSAAILDTSNGEVVWSFEGNKVRSFPLELQSPEEEQEARNSLLGSGFLTTFMMPSSVTTHAQPVYLNHLLSSNRANSKT